MENGSKLGPVREERIHSNGLVTNLQWTRDGLPCLDEGSTCSSRPPQAHAATTRPSASASAGAPLPPGSPPVVELGSTGSRGQSGGRSMEEYGFSAGATGPLRIGKQGT